MFRVHSLDVNQYEILFHEVPIFGICYIIVPKLFRYHLDAPLPPTPLGTTT